MVGMTIVSGFLGAGKTTLLRQLVVRSLARNERCVVIENEFGAVGLDAALMATTGVPVHELNHGCVCCTLKGSFAETLEAILVEPYPDRIFFEPSGIFTPDSLLEILRAPDIARRCRVDSFITVVDARHFSCCRWKFGSFFRRQSAFADTLAISKSEGIEPESLAALRAELQLVNPRAHRVTVEREAMSAAALDALLDRAEGQRCEASVVPLHAAERPVPAVGGGLSSSAAASRRHGLHAISGRLPAAMGKPELEEMLRRFADGGFGDIVRSKGRLRTTAGWIDFSLVAGEVAISEAAAAAADESSEGAESGGSVVVIGEALDEHGIRALWRERPDDARDCAGASV